MKIAILGWGTQGQSAYEYWNTADKELTVCDSNAEVELPEGTQRQLGTDYLQNLGAFDLLIRTPALHPRDIVSANGPEIVEKVWSNTNEFLKVCPSRNIIGVTGTKGKGTTSTLIAKMLEAAGKTVHLGGNIGIPPLALLKDNIQPDDWVVLELANFQLIDLKSSPHIAVCLMVEPEHLDWHEATPQLDYSLGSDLQSGVPGNPSTSPPVPSGTKTKLSESPNTPASYSSSPELRRAEAFDEYIAAKQQLFMHQDETDIAIYYAKNENSVSVADASMGQQIPYYEQPGAVVAGDVIKIADQEICKTSELKLLGKHNWQNACAAVTAVWQVTSRTEAIRSVLTTFTGLEHRLEFVRELQGVKYYDDSFGTTPETATVAIEAFEQPKVVILGGSDKGSDYSSLVETVKNGNVRTVVAIGQMGVKIADLLQKSGFTNVVDGGKTMPEIVNAAREAAQPGDVVLLSTACASFDLFKNYKDRGEQFSSAVAALV